jgi:hypothetical protein
VNPGLFFHALNLPRPGFQWRDIDRKIGAGVATARAAPLARSENLSISPTVTN